MRVLHIIRATGVAGAETHLLTLLTGLRARGLDAQLVLLDGQGRPLHAYRQTLRRRGVPLHAYAMPGHARPRLLPRLLTLLRRLRPHIVHTHLFHADLYGALAARCARVPALVSSRHNDNRFRRRQPWRALNRHLWRMTDAGIAISRAVADFATAVEGAPRARLRVIPYGLHCRPPSHAEHQALRRNLRAQFAVADDQPLLALACRLVPQKGVSDALQAFAGTRAAFPQARLLIAGDGPLRPQLETEAAQAGLTGSVRFLGWREDVPQLLAACDLFLMPSLWEGFGLVLLEAMAQRLPVVATDVSAIPEIVLTGETGLLVPPRDVPALRAALLTLLRDPPRARHMGQMGLQRLQTHFSAQRMLDDTIALYHDLLPAP